MEVNLTEEQVKTFVELYNPIRERLESIVDAIDVGYRHSLMEFEIEGNLVDVTVSEQQACKCCYEDHTYYIPVECLWSEDGVETLKQEREQEAAEAKRKREEAEAKRQEAILEKKKQTDLETYERVKREMKEGENSDVSELVQ